MDTDEVTAAAMSTAPVNALATVPSEGTYVPHEPLDMAGTLRSLQRARGEGGGRLVRIDGVCCSRRGEAHRLALHGLVQAAPAQESRHMAGQRALRHLTGPRSHRSPSIDQEVGRRRLGSSAQVCFFEIGVQITERGGPHRSRVCRLLSKALSPAALDSRSRAGAGSCGLYNAAAPTLVALTQVVEMASPKLE